MTELERLYTEGDRMLKATNPLGAGGGLLGYGPPPSGEDIDEWKRRVLSALPPGARGKFQVAPLKAEPNANLVRVGLGFPESEKAQRLRRHLEVLERIMGRMA